ncbi:MAG: MarR family winged helix-turn-helix transcriptional regulator [Gemmatimonadales bacterium]
MPHRATPPEAVAGRLHSAAIHLLRTVRRSDAALGVGPAQLSALSVLVFSGARAIAALAKAEQVSLPTMSRLVSALERDGLATRAPDPQDGRASIVQATFKGRRVLLRGRARRTAELARRLAALSTTERAVLDHAAALIERVI